MDKIVYRKIHEQIADRLKQSILAGELQPGAKLPSTKELSERYGVGMSTVREALSALKAMGLVESRQGEGSYVRKIEPADVGMPELSGLLMDKETILELLEARKALEVSNAGIAAEKRTEDDLRRFEALLAAMEKHLGDETEGERADMAFHLALARATHNSIIVRMLETVSSQMETAIRETRRLQMYASKSVSEQLWREHRDIYEAIASRDPQRAMDAMRQHLFHVERVLVQALR
ncbi:FadR/GntR family transcriptional regulator [Paenibacillus thermoaerophilus]|uniref:FadR/GntR family transcriptional regulator n=1 Tax=Paenibacillus thermoaerophilus TaxID=1215385 RepID=A0ABW2V854_9BACL|nr:FadR/GntR family transcriptional regulator [Paenibacillus thermoaerophilus]TMV17915.1 FadR family transcriptional regulator [Paenibacillus thermoaerophilus]